MVHQERPAGVQGWREGVHGGRRDGEVQEGGRFDGRDGGDAEAEDDAEEEGDRAQEDDEEEDDEEDQGLSECWCEFGANYVDD